MFSSPWSGVNTSLAQILHTRCCPQSSNAITRYCLRLPLTPTCFSLIRNQLQFPECPSGGAELPGSELTVDLLLTGGPYSSSPLTGCPIPVILSHFPFVYFKQEINKRMGILQIVYSIDNTFRHPLAHSAAASWMKGCPRALVERSENVFYGSNGRLKSTKVLKQT